MALKLTPYDRIYPADEAASLLGRHIDEIREWNKIPQRPSYNHVRQVGQSALDTIVEFSKAQQPPTIEHGLGLLPSDTVNDAARIIRIAALHEQGKTETERNRAQAVLDFAQPNMDRPSPLPLIGDCMVAALAMRRGTYTI